MSGTTQAKVPSYMDTAPRLGPADGFTFPGAASFRLGPAKLRVLLVEQHDLPLVNLRLTLPVGITRDPAAAPGLAHVTGQMMMEGAGSRSALQLSSRLLDLGATLRVWVDEDHTSVALQVLRRNLEPGLDLLADVLLRPRFTARDFKRVKGELRGRATQRRARPALVAYVALKAAVFGRHPYGRTLLPRPAQINALTLDQVRKFHRQQVGPAGAVVAVAGDISMPQLKQLLEARFGGWAAAAGQPKRPAPARPPASGPRLVLVHRPGATQSVIRLGQLAPPRRFPERLGLFMLNTVFGGSFTSRLNQNLREKHGFTYGARSQFGLMRSMGLFSVTATVDTPNTAAALRETLGELRALVRKPVLARELDKARRLVIEELPEHAETTAGLVDTYADLAAHGLPLKTIQTLAHRVSQLHRVGLQELAARVIKPDQMTIVVAGDAAKLRPALERAYGAAEFRDHDGQVVPPPPR